MREDSSGYGNAYFWVVPGLVAKLFSQALIRLRNADTLSMQQITIFEGALESKFDVHNVKLIEHLWLIPKLVVEMYP